MVVASKQATLELKVLNTLDADASCRLPPASCTAAVTPAAIVFCTLLVPEAIEAPLANQHSCTHTRASTSLWDCTTKYCLCTGARLHAPLTSNIQVMLLQSTDPLADYSLCHWFSASAGCIRCALAACKGLMPSFAKYA
jgi:hypothetical protein